MDIHQISLQLHLFNMPGKMKPSANTKKGRGRVKGGSVFDGSQEQVEQMELDADNESVAAAAEKGKTKEK